MLTVSYNSVSIRSVKGEWTIRELKDEVRRALSVDYVPAASARVRAVPDARTIRYYTTLGLLDRPASFKGRTAYYGRRHLLQLVAIKRLQAEGRSLAEVQARLAGLDDAGLEAIAELPSVLPTVEVAGEEPAPARRDAFWAEVPSPVAAAAAPAPAEPAELNTLVGVPLAGGVTLLLDTDRSLRGDDLEAIRASAGALLHALRGRGIMTTEM